MVISRKPIVLGNVPTKGKLSDYEKVAFMGQVPVRVIGKVNLGDYILPDGTNGGFGKAVSPENMRPEDFKNVVGVAWSASNGAPSTEINVAVGLNANAVSSLVEKQNARIKELEASIDKTNSTLAQLVPGFKEAMGGSFAAAAPNAKHARPTTTPVSSKNVIPMPAQSPFYTPELIDQAIFTARQSLINKGVDLSKNEFFKNYDSNPAYRNKMKQSLMEKFNVKILNDMASGKVSQQ